MNYNNYQNYGYNAYPNNYNQQYQQINNGYNQQQMNQNLNAYNNYQPQQQMRAKCDFIPVSNFEEVKSFLMNPNTTVLFKDVNNKILYEKKTDSQGISEIKAYRETNISQNNNNNNIQYVTIEDFNNFKNNIEERLNSFKGENNE